MSVNKHILEKQKQVSTFTIVPNEILNDKNLTFRDIGLYVYMLSQHNNLEFSYLGIAFKRKECSKTIKKMLDSLVMNGWMIKTVIKRHKTHSTYKYTLKEL
jgi:hypothetical protein